jgi:hypothetical protein
VIPFTPFENGLKPQSTNRFSADDVRRAAYWGLLQEPLAGVSYAAEGLANWERSVGPGQWQATPEDPAMWRKAMFMPGAKQISLLGRLVTSTDYWSLRPQPKAIAVQPGDQSPQRFVLATSTQDKDFLLAYVPEDRTLELSLDSLPKSPSVSWFNPRSGEDNPAVAVLTGKSCQFPTPGPGDWLLVLKAGKQ